MKDDRDYEVRSATDLTDSELIEVLEEGYGRSYDPDWFRWKHRDHPDGPSHCVVAEDAQGLIGVAFALPWRFRAAGREVAASRLCDSTTIPRAQRRGVLRAMVRHEIDGWDPQSRPGIVIATATPEARGANVKAGAVAIDPITYRVAPLRPWRAEVEQGPQVVDDLELSTTTPTIGTDWSTEMLRWRTDPRSGYDYVSSRLVQSDEPHGVVHRVIARKGLRLLAVGFAWGRADDCARVVRSLMMRERCVAVLAPMGDGTPRRAPRLSRVRGESLLCIWDQRSPDDLEHCPSGATTGWNVDGLDLEGVI